jgi:hypothetical protein
MDVFGRNPDSEAGQYFRANVWSWRPIHALVVELCSDLLDEATLTGMAFNGGAGAQDQATCTEMANRFERWLEHHTNGHGLASDLRVRRDGRFVREGECAENPDVEATSPYAVDDDHLKEWVEFLRHCGGFAVR